MGNSDIAHSSSVFFVLWDLEQTGQPWTWARFGPAFLNSIFLYLAAGLVLPGNGPINAETLLSDFDENGRLALIPLAVMHLVAIPLNILLHGVPLLHLANFLNIPLVGLITIVWFANGRNMQFYSTVLFGLIYAYAMLTVWSRPGI